jgi:branched-chain amino acid transport system permease protein
VGFVCLRTSGVAFIMITLAFAQMLFFLAVSLKQFGGDDGLHDRQPQRLRLFSPAQQCALYYAASWCCSCASRCCGASWARASAWCCAARVPTSGGWRRWAFRAALSPHGLRALGARVRGRGMLLANLTKFTSPSYMAWQASGDLIVMIVLGGMGTVVGPVVGAIALLVLEEILAGGRSTGW